MDYFRPLSYTVQIASRQNIPELVRQFNLVYQYLMDFVQGKRTFSTDGYLQRIIMMRDNVTPPFTDEELVGVLTGILLGGDQNILTMMTKIVNCLLSGPSLFRQLVDDPGMIPVALEEFFRIIPLGMVSTFPRIAEEDVLFSSGKILRGSAVYPDVFSANRDKDVFDDPLEIRFGRTGPRHLQFGYGMHSCMGSSLARMEILTVVEALVTQIPDLHLAASADQIPWHEGLILRRPVTLPVRW